MKFIDFLIFLPTGLATHPDDKRLSRTTSHRSENGAAGSQESHGQHHVRTDGEPGERLDVRGVLLLGGGGETRLRFIRAAHVADLTVFTGYARTASSASSVPADSK